MSKPRINKFIFTEAGFFIRLKTESKGLKVKKTEEGYLMEIPTHSSKGNVTDIPVIYLPKVSGEESAKLDALELGCESETLEKAINKKECFWGDVLKVKDFKTDLHYYYLTAKDKNMTVRIGPLHKGVDGSKIEMDFENLQWARL